jgi:hypothetical protein
MNLKRGILGTLAVMGLLGCWGGSTVRADEPIDFLRTVPLQIEGYPAAQCLSVPLTSAGQILQVLDTTPTLLVHMEALRRGYADLPLIEQTKLMQALHKRHLTNEKDLLLGFDLGYGELVYEHNKTGLFFLRKANDQIQDQFSNLAYGMAQVEADLTLENASPEEMTTRKMDAMYRLGDAVKIDAAKHQPGFWPSYVRVIEKIKPLAAYKSFSRRDFSLAYLPYGNSVVPLSQVTTTSSLADTQPGTVPVSGLAGALSGAVEFTCEPTDTETGAKKETVPFLGSPLLQRPANFKNTQASIQFYPTAETHQYQVRVLGKGGAPMLTFLSNTTSNVLEDVDGDGVFEIVARQYEYNPYKPIIVYHYAPCGFALDRKIEESFQ